MITTFVGVTPIPVSIDVANWLRASKATSVCMLTSGSFRNEEVIRKRIPGIEIRGNDVTLMQCAVGRFLMGDDHGGLEFREPYEALNEATSRVLVCAALDATLKLHRRWKPTYVDLNRLLERAETRYNKACLTRSELHLDVFSEQDFHTLSLETDAEAIIGFPPTYKRGYENMSKALSEAVIWEPPAFQTYDPDTFPQFAASIRDTGKPWCLYADVFYPDLPLLSIHSRSQFRTIYLYGEPGHHGMVTQPSLTSRFLPSCTPWDLTADSVCELRPFTESSEFQSVYHAYAHKGYSLAPSDPICVSVDGKFAGAFGYEYSATQGGGGAWLYVSCDFAVTGDRRLSKLIPMLACTEEVRRWHELAHWRRYEGVYTIILTAGASSQKYRGTGFKKHASKPGRLSYRAPWSGLSVQQTYSRWFHKHAKKVTQ